MSNVIKPISPYTTTTTTPLKIAKSQYLPSDSIFLRFSISHYLSNSSSFFRTVPISVTYSKRIHVVEGHIKALTNYSEGSIQAPDSSPASVDLEPILNESQFDRVIAQAQQLDESVVILWMATWCRKCIYLKPKLEKLAADYYPRVRFYSIDVNNVPHKLVVRAGITKMPTIQLWKDSKKQGEVIGGHKAYLVVNEVREMIENERTL